MTTRRRPLPGPLPPRGRSGRFGFPLAMRLLSVKTGERQIDPDGLPKHPRERSLCRGPLEAGEPFAGVGAASGDLRPRNGLAVPGTEAHELALVCAPAAAGALPDGCSLTP